jgi:hypothetical protein
MKKLVFIMILVSSLWSEEIKIDDVYEVYINKTVDIDIKGASKEEVFFGKDEDWYEKQSSDLKASMGQGLGSGAVAGLSTTANAVSNSVVNASGQAVGQGLGMGLGIGLVYGAIGLGFQAATANEIYVLVNDYTNNQGAKTRVIAYYYAVDFDDENVVKAFLEQEINKKYIK